jgi:glycosyltransferase involved in cell wall biosynthesis
MTAPRVSVLLPTHNAASHVRGALRSVLNQTFADFEVLVVDDGSADGTREIVESFEDDRVRLLIRDETGLASALNHGIEAARGEYVARQDADDRSAAERFERQVAFLDAHPSVAMVGTGARLVAETEGDAGRRHVLARPTVQDLEDRNRFVHGSVMLRASALRRVGGYDEFFDVSEDYDLWLRLAAAYPVRNLNEPLYLLHLRTESVYASRLEASKLYGRYATRRAKNALPDGLEERITSEGIEALYDDFSATERRAYHAELGLELLRYGDRANARRHCLRAISRSKSAVQPALIFALSFAPTPAVDLAARSYRTGLNARIRLRNRRGE